MKKVECKILFSVFIVLLSVFLGGFGNSYAGPVTVEEVTVEEVIEYDSGKGQYTQTYTLKNNATGDNSAIWWWGIFYESDPLAILDTNMYFDKTNYPELFPPSYTDVLDCPIGWVNTAIPERGNTSSGKTEGGMGFYPYTPGSEYIGTGFYSTYASDFESLNTADVSGSGAGDSTLSLTTDEEIAQAIEGKKINQNQLFTLGGNWSWNGSGANIKTSYGIGDETTNGNTGTYTIYSEELKPGWSFFYNTLDYWNCYYNVKQEKSVITSFEGGGATTRKYYWDGDGDGFGSDPNITATASQGSYTALVSGDCDDTDATIYPGASEICDSKDNDCDGSTPTDVVKFTFTAGPGGRITGNTTQFVSCSASCSEVEAVPANDGYQFSRWSDDSTSTSLTIQGSSIYKDLTAYFEIKDRIASIKDAPCGITNATSYFVTVWGERLVSYKYRVDSAASWSGEDEIDKGEPIRLTNVTEGEHTLEVIGKDTGDNWQATTFATTATWMVDTNAPTATIANCPEGTIGAGSINVTVGGEDVQFYKYKLLNEQWSVAFPIATPVKKDNLTEGFCKLKVKGRDTAGNWQTGNFVTAEWNIDFSIPTAVLSDLPDSITTETSADITVSGVGDDIIITNYKYKLDSEVNWTEKSLDEIIQLNGLITGESYTLYVNAKGENDIWQDSLSGETPGSATSYTWTVDTKLPIANSEASLPLSAAAGSPPTTVALLSWPSVEPGLKGYRLWYSDKINAGNLVNPTKLFCNITPGSAGHTETFTVKGLSSNTQYYFGLQSEDAAGNVSFMSNIASLLTGNTLPTITGFILGGITGDNSAARGLIITGTNFVSGTGNTIRFISSAGVFNVNSKSGSKAEIKVDVPAGAPVGTYKIRVCNMNGRSATSVQSYTVTKAPTPLPEVTNVLPAVGPNDADTSITITGDNFPTSIIVELAPAEGDTSVELTDIARKSDTEITATVPSNVAEGTYYLQVCDTVKILCNSLSIAKFEVYVPVTLTTTTTTDITTTKGVDMPDDGVVPVELSLSTDNREVVGPVSENNVEIEVSIDPGTKIMADGTAYSGTIDPPRQVPPTPEILKIMDDNNLSSNAVVFTMGSATEKLEIAEARTMFVDIEVTWPTASKRPSIYYLDADGSLTPAGVDGTYNGQSIESGGTELAKQVGVPEDGYTTYTFGLLLDHMSTFAVSSEYECTQSNGGVEVCDGLDNDCDGDIDEGFDADGDGFTTCENDCDDTDAAINPDAAEVCDICENDCVDTDAAINPDAAEVCDGIDNDCDGDIDEGFDADGDGFTICENDCADTDAAINPDAAEVCDGLDNDCDGVIDEGYDADGDGFTICENDCVDTDAAINPDAAEVCDGLDNDCDGVIDEGYDVDGDGFTTCENDCVDTDAAINPDAAEVCDGIDNDCDGVIDQGYDVDGDGFTTCENDCADTDAAINPGATEVCDGLDNDCDGVIDEGFDADGDGFTPCENDCVDTDAAINPDAAEVCDGIDNDCNGVIDEGYAPKFDTLPITEGKVDSLYSYTVTLVGEPPFSFTLTPPSSWISCAFDEDDPYILRVTGMPKDFDESYEITLKVENVNGTEEQNWNIYIMPMLSNNTFTGKVLSDPDIPFCDSCDVPPFKMEIYGFADHQLKASTSPPDESIIDCECEKDDSTLNYNFSITGLESGIYTIFVTDNDPNDTYTLNELDQDKEYETIKKVNWLKTGETTENIQMHVIPPELHKLSGNIQAPGRKRAYITLYGTITQDSQNLRDNHLVFLDPNGNGAFAFFVPKGTYDLLAWARGYKIWQYSGTDIQQGAELNFLEPTETDISLLAKQGSSLHIDSKQEGDKKLRLNFRLIDANGQPVDWLSTNEVKISLFSHEDDPNVTGQAFDPYTPSGPTTQLSLINNLGTAGIFEELYLTYLIDANVCSIRDFVKNGTHIYQVIAKMQFVNDDGVNLIDPLIQTFEVKDLPQAQLPIGQATIDFKVNEIFSSLSDIPISGNVQVGDKEIPIRASLNISSIDPSLLNTVNAQGEKLATVDQEEQLTLKVEIKPKEDQNCFAVDIKFTDDEGNIVEYNPPDPFTGLRDENAAPIIFDMPLPNDLQDKGHTTQVARGLMACDPNDFVEVSDGVYEAVEGKYGIYFETQAGVELFRPGAGEGIEIVNSETGLLMARVMAKHTSQWYQSPVALPVITSIPTSLSVGLREGGFCFIQTLRP